MYTYNATVVRTIDADTYLLKVDCGFGINFTEKFRLLGVDTPEVYGKNACQEGRDASAFVKKLLAAQPENFSIKTHKDKKGKYGRYLVSIVLTKDENGIDFEEEMSLADYLIEKGHAEVYPKKK